MSRQAIDRRQFLTLPLALCLAPLSTGRAFAAPVERYRAPFGVDVRLLYGVLTYHVQGTFLQSIDRPSGRGEACVPGEGGGMPPATPGVPSVGGAGGRSGPARSSRSRGASRAATSRTTTRAAGSSITSRARPSSFVG